MTARLRDLHLLPKVRDSWSYLYVEHARIDQEGKAIAIHDTTGTTPVPCSTLTTLMLGPGTTVTHAAIRTLADNGCLVVWAGEENVRFYAQGMGETRSAHNLLRQAWCWSRPDLRLAVVRELYQMRFDIQLDASLSLQQIRGLEGARVRTAYFTASQETGVPWTGRKIVRDNWQAADPVNRALSSANSCLYGVCHAAIVSAGYSPALGFVHTGKMLSFVYDIADLYKTEVSIPIAFRAVADGVDDLERQVRYRCRDAFHEQRLLQRIVPDIERALGAAAAAAERQDLDEFVATPGGLWDPEVGEVRGGVNWAAVAEQKGGADGGDGTGAGDAEPAR
ncbi:MAG: type I-E CRISPR-associated endonuclease Cas1 [Chloroflexi bacterium]|nr:MAG: type I-E CRISPR-associated endonuclease Cas1 [Chloroflexota bacterium]